MSDILSELLFESGLDDILQAAVSANNTPSPSISDSGTSSNGADGYNSAASNLYTKQNAQISHHHSAHVVPDLATGNKDVFESKPALSVKTQEIAHSAQHAININEGHEYDSTTVTTNKDSLQYVTEEAFEHPTTYIDDLGSCVNEEVVITPTYYPIPSSDRFAAANQRRVRASLIPSPQDGALMVKRFALVASPASGHATRVASPHDYLEDGTTTTTTPSHVARPPPLPQQQMHSASYRHYQHQYSPQHRPPQNHQQQPNQHQQLHSLPQRRPEQQPHRQRAQHASPAMRSASFHRESGNRQNFRVIMAQPGATVSPLRAPHPPPPQKQRVFASRLRDASNMAPAAAHFAHRRSPLVPPAAAGGTTREQQQARSNGAGFVYRAAERRFAAAPKHHSVMRSSSAAQNRPRHRSPDGVALSNKFRSTNDYYTHNNNTRLVARQPEHQQSQQPHHHHYHRPQQPSMEMVLDRDLLDARRVPPAPSPYAKTLPSENGGGGVGNRRVAGGAQSQPTADEMGNDAPRLSPQYYPTYHQGELGPANGLNNNSNMTYMNNAPSYNRIASPTNRNLPPAFGPRRRSPNLPPIACAGAVGVGANPVAVASRPPESTNHQPRKIPKAVEVEDIVRDIVRSTKEDAASRQMIATEDDEMEQIQVDTYVDYVPPKLRSGLPHPDNVVETVSLNTVSSPEIRYHMAVPEKVIDTGRISALQLEAALYACQAHEKRLPSGERVGYLIGDGAGVGKGRIIATIIYENYLLGRRRSLWLSVSSDLKFDAERDLSDIGADAISVYSLNKLKYAKINGSENGHIKKGVLFSTYASLIGECRSSTNTAYSSRLKQVLQWCGKDFDGVIVFDECHRAKNLCPTAGKSTKTGKFVLELQRALPSARVVYASATGATEPRNMAYMTRLGLWGPGQTFRTFNDFIHAVENRGVGAMEMVAMDMKLRGLYLARQLSFKGVGFSVEEVELTKSFIDMYDEAVKVWMECRRQFARALNHMPNEEVPRKQKVWAQFWSAHQRFFKYLCISAKVETCVKVAIDAIGNGKCVVIGLQSTGESQMLDYLEDNGELTEFVSTAKAVLQSLIEKHFPSYDDNRASAIDDFERMFLSIDNEDGAKKSRKRRLDDDPLLKKFRRREMSIESEKLYAERESGGNSAAEASDDSDELEEDFASDDDEESDADTEEDGVEVHDSIKDKNAEDLVDALMAELSSDDESDENRSVINEKAAIVDKKEEVKSAASELNGTGFGEVNPFCVDLTTEDPWARHQHANDNKNFVNSEKFKEKVVKKRKIKNAKRKKASALCGTNASEFIKSTNLVSDADERDGSLNLTQVKTDLLVAVERLGRNLPSNTLDQLINQLGGPHYVAEMTGRRGRMITKEDTGKVQYELRNADSDAPVEYMNMEEKEKFMNGEKLVAIISEAASSGISLQSDRRVNNHRRRVHITLELPWSADKAVQQFGRTHRSNQISAPEYLFLISELAGEKRFASIVAKRLESLGALTHGDRRATESRDLSQFNIDTKYGREALDIVYRTIVGAMEPLIPPPSCYTAGEFFSDMRVYMEGVGLFTKTSTNTYSVERDALYISKFLNRLLGLPVNAQNALFQYFSDVVAELIKQAKLDGTFDMGIMDLGMGMEKVDKVETRVFEGIHITNDFRVEMHKISLHRGVPWDEALSILAPHDGPNDGFYVATVGFQKRISVALIHGIGKAFDGSNHHFYAIVRPNIGRSPKPISMEELSQRFKRIEISDARAYWTEQYEELDRQCHHRYFHGKCNNEAIGRFCEVGRRTRTYFVLSGSVICVWPALEEILGEGKHNKYRRMQIVRVRTQQNQKVIGLLVLPVHVRKLVDLLEQRCK